MSKVTMPEPVAWLRSDELRKLGEPYSDSPINQRTDSMLLHAKGTEDAAKRYGFDTPVITTTQAEAYADARVRGALEHAAETCTNTMMMGADSYCGATARYCSDRIRALIPPKQ